MQRMPRRLAVRGPNKDATHRARQFRQVYNEAELVLWNELRGRRLNGLKFVRQFSIGPYFADFACRELCLVVEVDGSQHVDSEHDRTRDAHMLQNGWSIIRFSNITVLKDRASVLDTLVAIAEGRLVEPVSTSDFQFMPCQEGQLT
jgi:very-short-patch-repair endonuclease